MTTTIVMIMLLNRLIFNHRDLCLFASVVDNVPLVAACMGMYPVPELADVAASANAAHMMNYV